ncbi:MAG TPA: hypothetical protein V6C71_13530 [Coleofasciculaceae cyanobacterium]
MAKLPNEILENIFNLQQQLLECIDSSTATELALFDLYGEIEETIDYFEQLQNARERVDAYYSRLYTALRQIYTSQPIAPRDNLELLAKFMAEAEVTVAAVKATITEIRRDFDLS